MVLWETCLNSCFISNSGNIVLSFKIFNFFVYLLITSNSSNWIIFLVSSDRAYKGNIHWSHMTNVPHRIWKHNSSVLLLFFFFFSELAWLQCFVFPHKCLLSGRSLLFQWGLEDQKKKKALCLWNLLSFNHTWLSFLFLYPLRTGRKNSNPALALVCCIRLPQLMEVVRSNYEAMIDRAHGGPNFMMHSGISQASEYDDPPGLREKAEYLLREWVNLYHSAAAGRDSTKAFSAFVGQVELLERKVLFIQHK